MMNFVYLILDDDMKQSVYDTITHSNKLLAGYNATTESQAIPTTIAKDIGVKLSNQDTVINICQMLHGDGMDVAEG